MPIIVFRIYTGLPVSLRTAVLLQLTLASYFSFDVSEVLIVYVEERVYNH